MDPNDPIVKLCVDGMKAETEGRLDDALRLFMQAWKQRQGHYHACIAAHYVARHQKSAEGVLHWNQESLKSAEAVQDGSVQGFYPSLYLNVGKAHEDLGDREEAKKYYALAASIADCLQEGNYGDLVREAINRGLERVR